MEPIACPSCGEPLAEVEFCYHLYQPFVFENGKYVAADAATQVPPVEIRCAGCEEWLPKEIADAVFTIREK
jgi:hypothetical protein